MEEKKSILYRLYINTIFFAFILAIMGKHIDHDIYHYLIYGRDIMESGIPYINTHNIEPGLKIVLQEWLYDYIIYGVYKFTGWTGLTIYEIILFVIIFGLVYKILSDKITNIIWLMVSLIIVIFPITLLFSLRAQFISIILLLLQCYFIETEHNKWIFPLLLLLEINLHGSFWIFHYILLLPYLAPWLKNRQVNKKSIIITAIYSLPIMLLNPYGLDTILYPFKAYNSQLMSLNIAELYQFGLASIPSVYIFMIILIFASVVKYLDNVEIYIFIGLLCLSILHKRNLYFISFALLYVLTNSYFSTAINELISKNKDFINDIRSGVSKKLKIITLSIIIILLVFANTSLLIHKINSNQDHQYDNTVKFLEEKGVENVFTTFNTGTYLEWMGFKVYIDSCPEVFSIKINETKDILTEYINIKADIKENLNILNNYEYICTDDRGFITILEYEDNWKLVATDTHNENSITQLFQNISYKGD